MKLLLQWASVIRGIITFCWKSVAVKWTEIHIQLWSPFSCKDQIDLSNLFLTVLKSKCKSIQWQETVYCISMEQAYVQKKYAWQNYFCWLQSEFWGSAFLIWRKGHKGDCFAVIGWDGIALLFPECPEQQYMFDLLTSYGTWLIDLKIKYTFVGKLLISSHPSSLWIIALWTPIPFSAPMLEWRVCTSSVVLHVWHV